MSGFEMKTSSKFDFKCLHNTDKPKLTMNCHHIGEEVLRCCGCSRPSPLPSAEPEAVEIPALLELGNGPQTLCRPPAVTRTPPARHLPSFTAIPRPTSPFALSSGSSVTEEGEAAGC
eukprot:g24160.t1